MLKSLDCRIWEAGFLVSGGSIRLTGSADSPLPLHTPTTSQPMPECFLLDTHTQTFCQGRLGFQNGPVGTLKRKNEQIATYQPSSDMWKDKQADAKTCSGNTFA